MGGQCTYEIFSCLHFHLNFPPCTFKQSPFAYFARQHFYVVIASGEVDFYFMKMLLVFPNSFIYNVNVIIVLRQRVTLSFVQNAFFYLYFCQLKAENIHWQETILVQEITLVFVCWEPIQNPSIFLAIRKGNSFSN